MLRPLRSGYSELPQQAEIAGQSRLALFVADERRLAVRQRDRFVDEAARVDSGSVMFINLVKKRSEHPAPQ